MPTVEARDRKLRRREYLPRQRIRFRHQFVVLPGEHVDRYAVARRTAPCFPALQIGTDGRHEGVDEVSALERDGRQPVEAYQRVDQRIARKDVQHVLAAQRQVRRGTCGRDECGRTTSQVDEPTCQLDRDDGPMLWPNSAKGMSARSPTTRTSSSTTASMCVSAGSENRPPPGQLDRAHLEVRRQRLPPTGKIEALPPA